MPNASEEQADAARAPGNRPERRRVGDQAELLTAVGDAAAGAEAALSAKR